MKKITVLVLIVSLISLSQLSCTQKGTQKITKSDTETEFTLFTPLSTEYPAVNNPTHAWTYHWPEDYDKVLESMTPPCADSDGNCYFIGENNYLYSLNPSGEVRWNKKDYYGSRNSDMLIITEEGILAYSTSSLSLDLISFDGDILWNQDKVSMNNYLSPNGTLFCFTAYDKIIGLDSNGKTMWSTDINKYLHFRLDKAFFDSNSNGYFLLLDRKEDTKKYYYSILSVSSTGEIRWRKELPHERNNLMDEFIPNNTIQDTFLLAYTTNKFPETDEEREDYLNIERKSEKIVEAYNLDFEKIWEISNPKMGTYENKYAVDKANKFYSVFNEVDCNVHNSPFIKSYLSCLSKEGTEVFKKKLDSEIVTCPTFDSDHNMYLWIYGPDYNMCSLYPDGTLRWTFYLEGSIGCKFPIALSPVGSMFTTSKYQSLMFCVK